MMMDTSSRYNIKRQNSCTTKHDHKSNQELTTSPRKGHTAEFDNLKQPIHFARCNGTSFEILVLM